MAQSRRKERQRKKQQQQQRILAVALSALALALSAVVCVLMIGPMDEEAPTQLAQSVMLPYDADAPFSTADLTSQQLTQIRRDGRMHVSDGPRGISVGDPLDKVIERFPTDYAGEQGDDEQILYCAEVFQNASGLQTVLPPRGLLTSDESSIIVTLLAPVSAYPSGTRDGYDQFEHVYCLFTVEPDTMTVKEITLGIDK